MNAVSQPARGVPLFSRAVVMPGTLAEGDRSVDVIASTEALDSYGTVVRQNWRLDRFTANPVVLYAHDSSDLPIGTASEVRVEGGALRARLTFSDAELNPKAEQVWLNVRAGTVRGVSVGFWPHTVSMEMKNDVEFVVLDDCELYEISIVPVPSNAEALANVRQRASGQSHAPAAREGKNMSETTRAERKYHHLSYVERTALAREDPARHNRLKEAWIRAGRPALSYRPEAAPPELRIDGREYRNLTGLERARLSRDNPALYKRMRAHWQAAGQPLSSSNDGPEAA